MQGYGGGPGVQHGNVYSGDLRVEHIGDLLYVTANKGAIHERYNQHDSQMSDNLHEDFKYVIPTQMLIVNTRYLESAAVE